MAMSLNKTFSLSQCILNSTSGSLDEVGGFIGGFMVTSLFAFLLILIRLCSQKKNLLSIYWLRVAQELVKLNTWIVLALWVLYSTRYCLSKTTEFLGGKSANELIHKILRFSTCIAQKVFNTSGSYSMADLIVLWSFNIQKWYVCSLTRNWIAYDNEANTVNCTPTSISKAKFVNVQASSESLLIAVAKGCSNCDNQWNSTLCPAFV